MRWRLHPRCDVGLGRRYWNGVNGVYNIIRHCAYARTRELLEEDADTAFYLERADYYKAAGFDDSVYRLLREVQSSPDVLPQFEQIVVDEFQDFNPLEVAFIDELSKKGDILIVGDDDQAVYDDRSASPIHLRQLYSSREFEKFELPFCGRCPEVIVGATNCLIERAAEAGYLVGRIDKRYECYLDDKEADSEKYPKIVTANCTTARNLPKYIHREIELIEATEIADSHKAGKEYPTVLLVGKGHYLREIDKQLRPLHKQFAYVPSAGAAYGIVDAYESLIPNERSNIGWQILLDLYLDEQTQQQVLNASLSGKPLIELLPRDFVNDHMRGIELARAVRSQEFRFSDIQEQMKKLLGNQFASKVSDYLQKGNIPEVVIDKRLPTVCLTTFKGCKGLSAGHVFIVGVHNGCMPKNNDHISDVEISQFVVALTRTRKRCHILSNDWWAGPRNKKRWIPPFETSLFLDWIPARLKEDRGKLRAADLK